MTNYHIHTLQSGLKIAVKPEKCLVTYMGFAVRAGTRDESKSSYGLAHLVEHMLFKGTSKRTSTHIINRAEEVGAELNAYTTKEETFIYAALPCQYWKRIFRLLSDIVLNSRFPEEELSKEKTVIIDEINSYKDSPSEFIYDEFENMIFDKTPLGHNILGSERSINHISAKMARDFMRKYYRPDNMIFFINGDINETELIKLANQIFGNTHPEDPISHIPIDEHCYTPTHKRRRRDTYQYHVMMGSRAYSMHQPERIGLSLLLNILGGPGMNSKLNMALREHNGLVYNVESSYTAYSDGGMLAIYYACARENAEKAEHLVKQEFDKLIAHPISEEELLAAKRQVKGQLMIAEDSRENATLSFAKSILHYGKQDSLERVLQRIDSLTAKDLHSLATAKLKMEDMTTLTYI